MLKLKINEQEKNTLIQLIDLAVKSGGLRVAEAGVILAKRLEVLREEVASVNPTSVNPKELPGKTSNKTPKSKA